MRRKKKVLKSRPKKPGAPEAPPETLGEMRFRIRLTEALRYAVGDIPDAAYPLWVRNFGADLLSLLPSSIVEPARKDPREFLQGLNAGIAWSVAAIVKKMRRKDSRRFQQAIRSLARKAIKGSPEFTPKIDATLKNMDLETIPKEMQPEVGAKVGLGSEAAAAFFGGFNLGMNLEEELKKCQKHVDAIATAGERNDRTGTRRFLWLYWPEVQSSPDLKSLHRFCEETLAEQGDRQSVGSFEAFAKFCRREGIKL